MLNKSSLHLQLACVCLCICVGMQCNAPQSRELRRQPFKACYKNCIYFWDSSPKNENSIYIHKFSSCSKLVLISSAEHKRRCFEIYNVFQNILFFYSTEEKQLEGE